MATRCSMLLTLVRHGQSEGNLLHLLQGQADKHDLSSLGRQQAVALADHLLQQGTSFDLAYHSDLKRTTQTCGILISALGVRDVIVNPLIRERCFGVFEDRPVVEMIEAARAAGQKVANFVPAGAESNAEVQERAARFFKLLCDQHLPSDETASCSTDRPLRVLVVSHGVWIRELLLYLMRLGLVSLDKARVNVIPPNTSLTVLSVHREASPVCVSVSCPVLYSSEHTDRLDTPPPPPDV